MLFGGKKVSKVEKVSKERVRVTLDDGSRCKVKEQFFADARKPTSYFKIPEVPFEWTADKKKREETIEDFDEFTILDP